LEKLLLTFDSVSTVKEELQIRIEIEIEKDSKIDNENDMIRWDGGTSIHRTDVMKVSAITIEKTAEHVDDNEKNIPADEKSVPATYVLTFNGGLYKRSCYIPLNNKTLSSLANTMINIKCFVIKDPNTITQELPSKKGMTSSPTAIVLEEKIIEISIPLFSIIIIKGNSISGTFLLENYELRNYSDLEIKVQTATSGIGALLQGKESHMTVKLAADNDLAVCFD
jgi:hypothetical protein